MLVSQCLLLVFVVYWLVERYAHEKADLHDRLFHDFVLSGDQAQDSVLFSFLHPYLRDSSENVEIQVFSEEGDLAVDTTVVKQIDFFGQPIKHDRTVMSISHTDSSFHIGEPRGIYRVEGRPSEEFLMRGVKLILDISTDSIGEDHTVMTKVLSHPDTVLVQGLFKERIHQSTGRQFSTVWISDSMPAHKGKNQFVFHIDDTTNGPFMEVKQYAGYLFVQILPELFFGLILLVLTGAAFFFTYRSLRKQLALNTVRNEFISNISHELKTPVSTVKVALEAIQRFDVKKDTKATDEYIDMAKSEMDRLDKLTQKVLVHSQLESNEMGLELEQADLHELCASALRRFGDSGNLESVDSMQQIQDSKGQTRGNDETSSEFLVSIDPVYVDGVLVNLIDNAYKYARPEPGVAIELSSDQQWVIVEVRDQGPGIPTQYLNQVFDKFFRVPTENRHNIKGHGLGLSYASRVMELHKGSITVRNLREGGCCFTLKFPKLK